MVIHHGFWMPFFCIMTVNFFSGIARFSYAWGRITMTTPDRNYKLIKE
jgi:hypothetical protein